MTPTVQAGAQSVRFVHGDKEISLSFLASPTFVMLQSNLKLWRYMDLFVKNHLPDQEHQADLYWSARPLHS